MMQLLCAYLVNAKRVIHQTIQNSFILKIGLACLLLCISVTLAIFIPTTHALSDTTHTWTLNTSSSSNYGTSNVTIDDNGAHPSGGQTGANEFANPAFDSSSTSWNVSALPPSGWVEIPGNSTYGTSNFLAMKYEAKCANTSDLSTGLTSPATAVNTYDNNTSPCTSAANKAVVSLASGYPIANITLNDARSRCSTVSLNSSAAHLLTNEEFMTIAVNSAQQSSNWSGGSVGQGYLYAGQSDASPNLARIASNTDTGNYACAYTDGNPGTESPTGSCPTNTATGQSGAVGNQKRVFRLSNGAYIWDLAGNVQEFTQISQDNTLFSKQDTPEATTNGIDAIADASYNYSEFYGTGSTRRILNTGTNPPFSTEALFPTGYNYDSSYGMGKLYHISNSSDSTKAYILMRGGYYSMTTSGIFNTFMHYSATTSWSGTGFRCASDAMTNTLEYSDNSGYEGGGVTVTVGNISDGKLTQSVNVGDTSEYSLSAYVYDNTSGNQGGTLTSSIAELYAGSNSVTTTYTSVSNGWWRLTAVVTGSGSPTEYGISIKHGKTLKIDNVTLLKNVDYYVYPLEGHYASTLAYWDTICDGTIDNTTCQHDTTTGQFSTIRYQICPDDGSVCEAQSQWQYWDGDSWATTTNNTSHTNAISDFTTERLQLLSTASHTLSLKAIFTSESDDVPALPHISIGYSTDTIAPTTNASNVLMYRQQSGDQIASNGWTSNVEPYFSWTAGADNPSGAGVKGYCLYLGTDPQGDPATTSGLLGTSPVSTVGSTCQFISASTSIDFANSSYRGSTWLTTSLDPYYLNVKVVDYSGLVYQGGSAQVQFRFDNTPPINVSYISCPGDSFANIADMSFSWPTEGSVSSSDTQSQVLGWQYQINSSAGTWRGDTVSNIASIQSYLTTGNSTYQLRLNEDADAISTGSNIMYFRTIDSAGNPSSDATIRTCNLEYGGAAPTFGVTDSVTITPNTSTTNAYAITWPSAIPSNQRTVEKYYYMINTTPPSGLSTLEANPGTYHDNGTQTSVSLGPLIGANKGTNQIYVVAVDDAGNYSPSNSITGTFVLDSTNPDNVNSLIGSDSSIKSESKWYVTLTWTSPTYTGAGNLTYLIYRSSNGTDFTNIGSTNGVSYVDSVPSSTAYYYKVVTKDGANALSTGTNSVVVTPTGRWTSAPSLTQTPSVTNITTKQATINWTTSRNADSKLQYGTSTNTYYEVEASNSTLTTAHSLQISGLNPGTTYFYKSKWTDEDGNTGTSDEYFFTTAAAPTIKDVQVSNISLNQALITYTVTGASKVKLYYGNSSAFGGLIEIPTATSESTYSTQLTNLSDGIKYYYKLNTLDAELDEYQNQINDFQTLPRPKISNVKLQQVKGVAQSTILVTWTTNTEISSIVSYYPQQSSSDVQDEVIVTLQKGEHRMILRGLQAGTNYKLTVRGRDKAGNEAISDVHSFTTSTDTRPPVISAVQIVGSNIPPVSGAAQKQASQLTMTWNTDEPTTSQVEYGEGVGTSYSQKTQIDSNYTTNHLVVISNVVPSTVYHLRAVSTDRAGNTGYSDDSVTITPKATENALDLVIINLERAFGFLKGIQP